MSKEDIILDEKSSKESVEDFGRSEMGLDDFSTKWIKNAKVGESVELTIKKIYKITKGLEAVDPLTNQKFSTALSGVDYGVEIETDDGAKFGVRNWSTFGQIKALLKIANKIEGVKIKIDHLEDGMKRENKDKEIYRVYAFLNGSWKYLDKKGKVLEGK